MIGFWIINFFQKTGHWNKNDSALNRHVSFIEFGPGRGTLMKDIFRILLNFKLLKRIEVNFIEASPFLQKEQQETMRNLLKKNDLWLATVMQASLQRSKDPVVET